MSSDEKDTVKLVIKGIETSTPRAVCVTIKVKDNTFQHEWFPINVVDEIHQGIGEEESYITIKRSVAEKRGLV